MLFWPRSDVCQKESWCQPQAGQVDWTSWFFREVWSTPLICVQCLCIYIYEYIINHSYSYQWCFKMLQKNYLFKKCNDDQFNLDLMNTLSHISQKTPEILLFGHFGSHQPCHEVVRKIWDPQSSFAIRYERCRKYQRICQKALNN